FRYILCMLIYLLFLPAITLFRNRERFAYHYRRSVLAGTGTALLSELTAFILVLFMPEKLTGRIVGSILPTMLIGTVLYVYFIRRGHKPEPAHVRYALPIALPYVPHLLSMIVLHSMDKIMIIRLCGEEENALYSLAYNCGMMTALLQSPMDEAFSPWLAKRLALGERQTVRQMSLPYFGVLAYGALGVMLVSPEVLWVLGGMQYAEARYVIPPITLGFVCQFAYMMLVNVEQYRKKTVGMALASVSAAVLNCVLNLLFIPRFGYIAAAYTTLAGYLWLYTVHLFLVKRLGDGDLYKNRAILGTMAVLCTATAGVTVLYSHAGIRYAVLAVYLGVTAVLFCRYRSVLQQVLFGKK
ncbi:MAG: polysaccharide biosynthesis C-terminal domain-containing protein, partial [Oscillospiraceae bacterium]|nr:polysaccharide biosynthesis C-terminal domain-containing protein [Oscillospiraceae bacterium]